jgi:hypothetical protein
MPATGIALLYFYPHYLALLDGYTDNNKLTNGDLVDWASDSFPEYIVSLGWRCADVYFGVT